MALNDVFGNGQPQACAALASSLIGPVEPLEDPGEVFSGDPYTCLLYTSDAADE